MLNFKLMVPRKLTQIFAISVLISIVLLLILDILYPPNLSRFKNTSTVLLDKDQTILSLALSKDEYWRIPITIDKVDPLLAKMLVSYEDKRFYYHYGVDPIALCRAFFQWMKAGYVISGGSTLTMQTARLLEPRPRTLINKLIECLRAIQLEMHFSKKNILEMHFCLAPYGGNYEGIYAASLRYFNKNPHHLTPSEAALLVIMPQSPNHLRPEIYPERALKFRNKILARLEHTGIISSKAAAEAKSDAVPNKIFPFPRHALHLMNMLKNSKQGSAIGYTTLHKTLQLQIEQLLISELSFLEPTQTIAVVVVDNKTRAICAYIGNADFFSEDRRGQINMVESIRSPGSTLKPFIYGLAIDDTIIHPETILQDVPTIYGDYAPSNFKDIFHGDVTVREALQQSLNIPAITVLDKIKPGRFLAHLQYFGIKLIFHHNHRNPTLPIALGGVGMTLRDLMSLYVALGNDGSFTPITLWQEEKTVDLKNINSQLMSPYAAWHINHILEGTPAPEGFINGDVTTGPVIAYKTGTSFGFRDALALGFTRDYTIGVWVGKPTGSPSFNQTGRGNAAPILFKIARFLPVPDARLTSKPTPLHHMKFETKELPISLRKLDFKKKNAKNKQNFYFQFPKDGMLIDLAQNESNNSTSFEPITLVIRGGEPPFYLFQNGQSVMENILAQHFQWKPYGLGFQELTIIDSAGNSDSVTIEIQSS